MADDAGATEVALLLDEVQYPSNSILGAPATSMSYDLSFKCQHVVACAVMTTLTCDVLLQVMSQNLESVKGTRESAC